MEQAFSVEVKSVPLPSHLKRKWEQGRVAASNRITTLDELQNKMEAAEQRREKFWQARKSKAAHYKVRTVHDPSAARERLEKRLAAAEAKRQAALHAVRLKAAVTVSRAAAVARAEADRRLQLQSRLEQSLEAAGQARAAHLADTAARAARVSSRASTNARVVKQREQTEAASKLTTLLHRMKRAAATREQALNARTSSSSSSEAPSGAQVIPFQEINRVETTQNEATHQHQQAIPGSNAGEWLRLQAAARRIQFRWRSFSARTGTTEARVTAFIDSGIPFSVNLTPSKTTPTAASTDQETRSQSPPLRGPTTPPMPVPLLHPSQQQAMACSPSPRRQPVARSASSVAEMAATLANRDEAPAPLPASFHASALSFDEFAEAMSAPTTLHAAQALLRRLEVMGKVKGTLAGGASCEGLLRRLFPRLPKGKSPDRYPARAFLSSYMILAHPEVVLSQQGPRESALSGAASTMLNAFETLLAHLAPSSNTPSASLSASSLAVLLRAFDETWISYLEQFVAWKSHDAAGLEAELIRAAVELETSRLSKIAARERGLASQMGTPPTPRAAARAKAVEKDMEALVEGVDRDLVLISERVERLTGPQGAARLAAALAAARAQPSTSPSSPEAPQTLAPTTVGASTSQSPAKKMPRRTGQYAGTAVSEEVEEQDSAAPPEPSSSTDVQNSTEDGNMVLMWQLLYNSTWQLPMAEVEASWKDATGESNPMDEPNLTPEDLEILSAEDLAQVLHSRVRRIAEKAFWDGICERLQQNNDSSQDGGALKTVASLLAEARASLVEALPSNSSISAEVEAQLGSVDHLVEVLSLSSSSSSTAAASPLPGVNCGALFGLLEWCGTLLRRLGAPARESAAASAQAAVRRDLVGAADTVTAAAVVTRALRLVAVLLKMLRLDLANAHLSMLSRQLGTTPQQAALYARTKIKSSGGLGDISSDCSVEELAARLPHTRGWLALVSGRVPHTEALINDSVDYETVTRATAADTSVPRRLQTGRTSTSLSSAKNSPNGTTVGLAGQLVAPVAVRSWRGLVRGGLAQLVAGDSAVTKLAIPETLRPDAVRLQGAQNDFQRLVVLTASLVALKQAKAAQVSAQVASPAEGEELRRGKRRLSAVLAAPDVCLADIAAEIANFGQVPEQESSIHAMLRSTLGKSSAALRSITSGLSGALAAHLLLGPSTFSAQTAALESLKRCGAVALAEEVADLAAKLAEVAAVTEAVCEPWYEKLTSDLIQ